MPEFYRTWLSNVGSTKGQKENKRKNMKIKKSLWLSLSLMLSL
ncbi:hypothetical protein HMPREF1431_00713, partial [Helicobacter pylori GAMchJs106B]